MKSRNIDFLLVALGIAGVVFFIYKLLKKPKETTTTINTTKGTGYGSNPMAVSTTNVNLDGKYWFSHISENYNSNVTGKHAGVVVESIVDKYRQSPELYDEMLETAMQYQNNNIAVLIVRKSLDDALMMGLIERKTV